LARRLHGRSRNDRGGAGRLDGDRGSGCRWLGRGIVRVIIIGIGSTAELADALPKRLTDLWQLPNPKDQDDDDENDDELWGPQCRHHVPPGILLGPRLSPPQGAVPRLRTHAMVPY